MLSDGMRTRYTRGYCSVTSLSMSDIDNVFVRRCSTRGGTYFDMSSPGRRVFDLMRRSASREEFGQRWWELRDD